MQDSHRANLSASRKGKMTGDSHPLWKGDEAGYDAMHTWLARHRERTGICEFCMIEPPPKTNGIVGTDFANISGSYLREVTDYYELCRRCHIAFDRGKQVALKIPTVG